MEERGREVGGDHESDQCAGAVSQGGTARDAGGGQVHRRADQRGQDLHRRGGERGAMDAAPCSGKGCNQGGVVVGRYGSATGKAAGKTIKRAICQSWFLLPATGELPLDAG